MCWNKVRLCWKTAKLFYFCHLKKVGQAGNFWTLLRNQFPALTALLREKRPLITLNRSSGNNPESVSTLWRKEKPTVYTGNEPEFSSKPSCCTNNAFPALTVMKKKSSFSHLITWLSLKYEIRSKRRATALNPTMSGTKLIFFLFHVAWSFKTFLFISRSCS